MRMKFSLQRFVGFLCITALAVISALSFSQTVLGRVRPDEERTLHRRLQSKDHN